MSISKKVVFVSVVSFLLGSLISGTARDGLTEMATTAEHSVEIQEVTTPTTSMSLTSTTTFTVPTTTEATVGTSITSETSIEFTTSESIETTTTTTSTTTAMSTTVATTTTTSTTEEETTTTTTTTTTKATTVTTSSESTTTEKTTVTEAVEEVTEVETTEEITSSSLPITEAERIMLTNLVAHEYGANWVSLYEKGKIVMCVMNRVNSSKFPNTIHKVILQKNQFCNMPDDRYIRQVTQSCIDAVYYYFNHVDDYATNLYFYTGDGKKNHFRTNP